MRGVAPDRHGIRFKRVLDAADRDVKIRVLTNSLASHYVPAVNSHYKQRRKPVIQAGVDLHEIRPDAAIKPVVADTPPTDASRTSSSWHSPRSFTEGAAPDRPRASCDAPSGRRWPTSGVASHEPAAWEIGQWQIMSG